jgi:hypothetical protein
MKPHIMKLLVLLFGLFFINVPTFSQSKFVLSAGIGEPEFFNVKIKYGQNLQFGICVGGYIGHGLWGSNKIIVQGSCAAEIEYHFLGKSKYVEQPPWYTLGGLGYYDIPISGLYGSYDIGFYPRIGRTFNLSKRSGINLDVGTFLPLSMRPDYNTYDFKILPSGNISFLIRF